MDVVSTEITQSTLITTKNTNITVASVYCPSGNSLQPELLNLFQQLGPTFIAGGDYNSKHEQWGCRSTNTRGHRPLGILNSSQLLSPSISTLSTQDQLPLDSSQTVIGLLNRNTIFKTFRWKLDKTRLR